MIKISVPADNKYLLTLASQFFAKAATEQMPAPPASEQTPAPPVADTDHIPPASEQTPTPPVSEQTPAPPVADTDHIPPATANQTDSKGVVWSADFHTSNKSVKGDGTWKAKPGVDKEAKEAYESQFQATGQPPAPSVSAPGQDVNFQMLMDRITSLQSAGKLTTETLGSFIKITGFNSLPEIIKEPAAITTVYNALGTL